MDIKEAHRAVLAHRRAERKEKGGQLSAVESFAEKGLDDLREKKKKLALDPRLTSEGVTDALKKDRDKYVERGNELRDTILEPKRQKAQQAIDSVSLPDISDREFAQHSQLLTSFNSMPNSERMQALARALAGIEPELARALAHEPRFISKLTVQTHEQLIERHLPDSVIKTLETSRETLAEIAITELTIETAEIESRKL